MLRSRFADEIDITRSKTCTSPVLLKLVGEDEGVWEGKMQERERMKEVWGEKRDRENWVLPRADVERRGAWSMRGLGRRESGFEADMGEGVGRRVFVELRVVGVEIVE
jgi:hypothetical protein